MESRTFSKGTAISVLGLGCSRVGSLANPVPMMEIRETIAHAIDAGVTHFDTANVYGQGDSELELGRAVRAKRADVFIVTKGGKKFSTKVRLIRALKPLMAPFIRRSAQMRANVQAQRASEVETDFSPKALTASLEGSLRRLGTDSVGAYLLHSPDADVLRRDETLAALESIKAAGKSRHVGVSCDTPDTFAIAASLSVVDIIQVPLSVLNQAAGTLHAQIAERGCAIFAREVVREAADKSPTEALRMAARTAGVTSVVVGTSQIAHLKDLLQALAAPSEGL